VSALALDDRQLTDRLRQGDATAFEALVERYQGSLLRTAMVYVNDRTVAEEVVQEAWVGVLRGLDRFENRSLFKTWVFRIVANIARTRGARERRTIPFSSLASRDEEGGPSVAAERFLARDSRWAGHWAAPPVSWDTVPEQRLASKETLALIGEALEALPLMQRQVISLRDVEGWTPDEVCSLLEISEGNQRVLLHRARSRVRAALEHYLD
jgi:RNA polymerase sigma-70 factor, ECF subfamily